MTDPNKFNKGVPTNPYVQNNPYQNYPVNSIGPLPIPGLENPMGFPSFNTAISKMDLDNLHTEISRYQQENNSLNNNIYMLKQEIDRLNKNYKTELDSNILKNNTEVEKDYNNKVLEGSKEMKKIITKATKEVELYSIAALNMAKFISESDIDESICKKTKCKLDEYEENNEKCIECIISHFNKDSVHSKKSRQKVEKELLALEELRRKSDVDLRKIAIFRKEILDERNLIKKEQKKYEEKCEQKLLDDKKEVDLYFEEIKKATFWKRVFLKK